MLSGGPELNLSSVRLVGRSGSAIMLPSHGYQGDSGEAVSVKFGARM